MINLKTELFKECKKYQDAFDKLSSRDGLNSSLVCCIHEGHMALFNLITKCGLAKEYEEWCESQTIETESSNG